MADEDQRRTAAIGRLQAKRGFQGNLISFVAVSVLLIVIWALSGRGYFWPIWVIGFWDSAWRCTPGPSTGGAASPRPTSSGR